MKPSSRRLLACLLFLLAVVFTGCEYAQPVDGSQVGLLAVHFIDVGQADAILVTDGTYAVLIDAGSNADGKSVVSYLRDQGIERLTYAVGTHPHEDHIGGLDTVLSQIPTGEAILSPAQSDTSTYQDVFGVAKSKKIPVAMAEAGAEYAIGSFTMQLLGPVKEYDDLNNSSVVVKILYGETSFLMTGDIEEKAEKDILSTGYDISCDVLKAPHHGSDTSSSYLFLRESNPSMVVISCGKGNRYGHPHEGPLSKYRDVGAEVFRTDTMGTIVMTSDGVNISANVSGEASDEARAPKGADGLAEGAQIVVSEYIGNMTSKKFHLPSCANLPAEKNRVAFTSRKEALEADYLPCGACKP